MFKTSMKKVFDQAFNQEDMRSLILLAYEKKTKKWRSTCLKYALPLCMVLCGLLVLNHPSSQGDVLGPMKDGPIVINKIENLGALRFDANIKDISDQDMHMSWLNELKDKIIIPYDLNQWSGYALYTRKDKTSEYNILNCYVYDYTSDVSNKHIRIAFSDTTKPLRDYGFSDVGIPSQIRHTSCTIHQYEDLYFTEFIYQGYHFDIETHGLSLTELMSLLQSLVA